ILDCGTGIYCQQNSNATISANEITACGVAIRMQNSNSTILNNTFTNTTEWPINLDLNSSGATIQGNTYAGNMKGIKVDAGTLTSDATWGPNGPYVFFYNITIADGVTLTFAPGAIIKFGPWYMSSGYSYPIRVTVNGRILSQGTPDSPVVITTIYDDSYGGDTFGDGTATTPAPQAWGKIGLYNIGLTSIFEHSIIRYGGGGAGNVGAIDIYGLAEISHSYFEHNGGCGIMDRNASIISNTAFRNNGIGYYSLSGTPIFTDNSFQNNNSYGAYNSNPNNMIVLENNYWGDSSGPYHPTQNPSGLGDKVSDYIDFDPWLNSPGAGFAVADLMGTVTNGEYDIPLSETQVLISSDSYNSSATTGNDGEYLFSNIPIGTYQIIITKDRYFPETIPNVVVTENTQSIQNATLKKIVQNGDVLVEISSVDEQYVFGVTPIPGAMHYNFYFLPDNRYHNPDPDVPFNLIQTQSSNLVLTPEQWTALTTCKYDWYVISDNGVQTPSQSFLKINMYPADNYSATTQNLLLLHGWNSNNQMWEDIETQFAAVNQFATWKIDYPNTGHIPELASVIPKCIEYLQAKSGNPDDVNIIAHSMGGLLARAYINGIGKTVSGDVVNYNDDVDKIVLLATPNTGGRFSSLINTVPNALSIGLGGVEQFAAYDMGENSTFINFLNQQNPPADVSMIAFAGYDSNIMGVYSQLLGDISPWLAIALKLVLNGIGPNDGVVSTESATFDYTIPYKLMDKHHLNIYQTNSPNDLLMSNIFQFFNSGQIIPDDIGNWTYWSFLGNSFENVFLENQPNLTPISGGVITFRNLADERSYVTPLNHNGTYHINYLPPADYLITAAAAGFLADSATISQSDTINQVQQNFFLETDPFYQGSRNMSLLIDGGDASTVDTIVTLTLSAENASEMTISNDIEFTNADWQTYDSSLVHLLQPGGNGIAIVYAKFRSATGIESDIVADDIVFADSIAGSLQINSNYQSRILINDELTRHRTPYTFDELAAGSYTVSAIKSGFVAVPQSHTVQLAANQSQNINFQFQDIPPQPPNHLQGGANLDTIALQWRNPSVDDLYSVTIAYRLDGMFPAAPGEGVICYDSSAVPDAQEYFSFMGIDDTTYYFSIFARDLGGTYSVARHLPVTVPHVNTAPQIIGLTDNAFNEDSSLVLHLNDYAIDDDPFSSLHWEIYQLPAPAYLKNANLSAVVGESTLNQPFKATNHMDSLFINYDSLNQTVTFSASANYFTLDIPVAFILEDPYGAIDSDTMLLSILSVNDPPVILDIPPIVFPEDSIYHIDLDQYVTDVDHDTTQISWYASIPESSLSDLRPGRHSGQGRYRSTEGIPTDMFNNLTTSQNRENRLARKTSETPFLPEKMLVVSERPLSLKVHRHNKTGQHQRLGITYGENDSLMIQIDSLTHIATISATANFFGLDIPVIFTAVDDSGASDTDSTLISVQPVNDPPVISSLPTLSFNEDDTLTNVISDWFPYVLDPDTPVETLSYTVISGNQVTAQPGNAVYFFYANANWFGQDTLQLIVSDSVLADTADLFVIVNPVNDPPLITALPDTLIFEADSSTTLLLWDYVEDIETPDSMLAYQFSAASDSLLYHYNSSIGVLTLSAQPLFHGVVKFNIVVIDDSSSAAADSLLAVILEPTGITDPYKGLIPDEYVLLQNYPNPFNPLTHIRFGLPRASSVTLEIYNILGQKVATLVDQRLNAGYHQVPFEANRFASGLYFYRLNADGFHQVKKMLLMK
ncbi:MAG: alpha/beta fold hydrolase, partial [Calditrichaeota bacterium]|nr:alpha/beta fold hydrolase [Calditrichota bacterium]